MPCSCRRRGGKAARCRRFCSVTSGLNGPRAAPLPMPTRTAGEFRNAATARREERERVAAERKAQELARQARTAAAAREQRLDALALREEQAWQHVDSLISSSLDLPDIEAYYT